VDSVILTGTECVWPATHEGVQLFWVKLPVPTAWVPFQLVHLSLPSQVPASPHERTIFVGLNFNELQLIAQGWLELLPAASAADGTARTPRTIMIFSALRICPRQARVSSRAHTYPNTSGSGPVRSSRSSSKIACMSSSVSSKSNNRKFSSIRAGVTD